MAAQSGEKNHPVAELNLGILANAGVGMPKDDAQAATWFRMAAEQGDPGAQNHLGFAYEHGLGIAQNHAEALGWYHKAAAQDDAEAQFNLAIMTERGEGTAKDQMEAVRWLRKSAERGFALAQIDLANHYLTGEGIARDPGLAYFWSAIGASHPPANQAGVAATMRESASHQIAPDEVTRIQGLAAQWHPGVDVATLMPSSTPSEKIVPPNGTVIIVRSTGTGFAVTRPDSRSPMRMWCQAARR